MLALSEAAAQVLPFGRRLLKIVTVGLAEAAQADRIVETPCCSLKKHRPQIVIAPHIEGKVPPFHPEDRVQSHVCPANLVFLASAITFVCPVVLHLETKKE